MRNLLVAMPKSSKMGNEEGNVVNVVGLGVFGPKRGDPNPNERLKIFWKNSWSSVSLFPK
jgi:hypothetical protein